MDRRFLVIILVILAGLGGLFWVSRDKNGGPTANGSGQPSNYTIGAGSKGVTLVEFGDFQCPHCGRFFPIVEEVRQKYGDDITFQFRHFPLPDHTKAFSAHRAAEAAGMQNKFYEMYQLLFSRQQSWINTEDTTKVYEQYAQEIGLDVDKFRLDYASEQVNKTINADRAAGKDLEVAGTPTFYLNGQKIDPRDSVESFSKLIDDAIAERAKSQGQTQ